MHFLSVPFLCFLPVAGLLSCFLPFKQRWKLLLIVSLLFIGLWNPGAMLVLLLSSLFTFYTGLLIEQNRKFRAGVYLLSVTIQVLSLFLLKYVESGSTGLHFLFHEAGFRLDLILYAAGFSFYTLQHIGYITEIYYLRSEPEKNPLDFLLFSSFFAKFSSGPLEQAPQLIAQFRKPSTDLTLIYEGIQRVVLGIFKKMVLADRLSPAVAHVFEAGQGQGSAITVAGACLFTVQLYFDFSAYSDMAIGSAKIFGIRLTENFDRPFLSTSVSEFWRRWHISLISWFSNYIYYPLVFRLRRYKGASVLAGILVTFLLSGLWHGLGFTFFIWSLLHICFLCFESLTKNIRLNASRRFPTFIYKPFSTLITFLLICFSNLFFRAPDITVAKQLFLQLQGPLFLSKGFMEGFLSILAGGGYQEVLFNFYLTLMFTGGFLIFEKHLSKPLLPGRGLFLRTFFLVTLIFVCGIFKQAEYFIYQQF